MSNRRKLRRPGWGAVVPPGKAFPVPVQLRESAATVERVAIAEATMGSLTPAGGRRYRARLIEGDRWGTSGYWPAKVLERDGPTAWPAGTTQVFLDHPSIAESADRPERSVRDLAGRVVSTPVYEGDGLYADIEVFPHAVPLVEALADAVGLSVRGDGSGTVGKVGDRSGIVIESIDRGYSVDFVTKAGAGGKLVSLVEAAREGGVQIREARNIGAWIEAQLHSALTDIADQMYGNGQLTRDERITLSNAVGDALQAWTARVEKDAGQLFTRDLYDGPPEDGTAVSEAALSLSEVSDTPWSQFSASDYTPEQYRRACLLDTGQGSPDSKDRYKLPVKQPDGTVNRNGVHAAASALAGGRGGVNASADAKKAAARKLVGLYRSQLKEDPPPSLLRMAGMGEAAVPACTGAGLVEADEPMTEPPPLTDVTGGAPPAEPNPPEKESSVSGTNTGPAPGAAGATEATAVVPAAVTEAEQARVKAEQERDTAVREAQEMRQSLARLTAVEAARPIASSILSESNLPLAARDRVLAAAVRDVPLAEADELRDGAAVKVLRLDEATFRTAVAEAAKAEETYVASLREAAGDGRVTGVGAGLGAGTAGPDATKQFETSLAESFKRLGMSSDAALVAAGGRR